MCHIDIKKGWSIWGAKGSLWTKFILTNEEVFHEFINKKQFNIRENMISSILLNDREIIGWDDFVTKNIRDLIRNY